MSITQTIQSIIQTLPSTVSLVAVSKTHPASLIQEAYDGGQRIFGESKAQELSQKHAQLPADIQWHFIGHLQTNKIKYITPFVSLVHSIDSLKLLVAVDKEAEKANRVIDCLLQMHIAVEDTKFGLSWNELESLLQSPE